MKPLVYKSIDHLIQRAKELSLIDSVRSNDNRAYTISIGRDIMVLTKLELKWFLIGRLYDIKEE
jgi:hypothetical protein